MCIEISKLLIEIKTSLSVDTLQYFSEKNRITFKEMAAFLENFPHIHPLSSTLIHFFTLEYVGTA